MVITEKRSSPLKYALAYLMWAVSTGLGIFALYLLREVVMLAMVVSNSAAPDQSEAFYQSLRIRAASNWTLFLLGIFLLVLLVGFENLYRTRAGSGGLTRIFTLITGVELAILAFAHILMALLEQTFRPFSWLSIVIPLVEALLAGLFLWLWNRKRST